MQVSGHETHLYIVLKSSLIVISGKKNHLIDKMIFLLSTTRGDYRQRICMCVSGLDCTDEPTKHHLLSNFAKIFLFDTLIFC